MLLLLLLLLAVLLLLLLFIYLFIYLFLQKEKENFDFIPLNRALCLSTSDLDSTESKIDELLHHVTAISHKQQEHVSGLLSQPFYVSNQLPCCIPIHITIMQSLNA